MPVTKYEVILRHVESLLNEGSGHNPIPLKLPLNH
jgi:hypothetical protein